ncbi:hypothetical protein NHX12_030439 [Muraenolepis orangiensis]|uniref:Uncharacterized protein n=1 Tax=Muraenolepis orangiensis TaxID=630683 RepID=A0A9Q0EC32_9TELE|nr:hypothetical protein NHX12_030439 [Muraenolepis orangiensis]
MDAESQRVLQYLTEVEEAAEDVLTDKQQRDIKHAPPLSLFPDQEQLDKEINNLRKELKAKVNHLNVIQDHLPKVREPHVLCPLPRRSETGMIGVE